MVGQDTVLSLLFFFKQETTRLSQSKVTEPSVVCATLGNIRQSTLGLIEGATTREWLRLEPRAPAERTAT